MLPLFLYYKKVIHKPYFYLSTYFEKNRNKYYSTLNAISKKEDWKSWIIALLPLKNNNPTFPIFFFRNSIKGGIVFISIFFKVGTQIKIGFMDYFFIIQKKR